MGSETWEKCIQHLFTSQREGVDYIFTRQKRAKSCEARVSTWCVLPETLAWDAPPMSQAPFHPFRGLMQARVHTQPCTTASPRPFFSSWNSQLMGQPFAAHDSSVTSTYNLSGAVLGAFFPPDLRHLPLLPANRSVSQVFCLLKEGRSGPGPTPGGRNRAPRATWLH